MRTSFILSMGAAFGLFSLAAAQVQGPSSSETPYLLPVLNGSQTVSLLTVGDAVNNKPNGQPYRMVGIPDGLGLLPTGEGRGLVLMNHELGANVGIERRHGSIGAFVSRWDVRRDFTVLFGDDLISANPDLFGAPPYARLCSADLPVRSAFFNPASGLGTQLPIFMNGEENGAEGRAFGHLPVPTGVRTTSFLPYLGRFSWENAVASPYGGDSTIVVGLDDSTPGEVYVYIGRKSDSGNPFQRAGLFNGRLFGIKVDGVPSEDRLTGIGSSNTFTLHDFGNVSTWSGARLQTESDAAAVTKFLRPEDGAWSTVQPNVFYFCTTDRYDQVKDNVGTQVGRTRLWKVTFDSATNPTGGRIEAVLDGTEATQMIDNLCVDKKGNLLLQEDVGNQLHNGKIWYYDATFDTLTVLFQHDPARFGDLGRDPVPPFSADEEASGIIDASELFGDGWFLCDVQAHYNRNDSELVEGGQLLAVFNPLSLR